VGEVLSAASSLQSNASAHGTLVIQKYRTWLLVSRYYILTVGLLGRYGHQDDGGKIFNINPLRPDLDELRLLERTRRYSKITEPYRSRVRSCSPARSDGESNVSIYSIHEIRMDAEFICGHNWKFSAPAYRR
jgi:hypothetical protein